MRDCGCFRIGGPISSGWISAWAEHKVYRYFQFSTATVLGLLLIVTVQSVTGIIPLGRKEDLTLDGHGWRQVVETLEDRGVLTDQRFLLSQE